VYLLLGVVESVAAMTAYGMVLRAGGWHWGQMLSASDPLYLRATTACLTAIVITQAANVFACRSETRHVAAGVLPNRLLTAGVVIELVLIACIDYTPWGHQIFGTAAIGWGPWVAALPFAAALLVLDALWKRHRGRANQRISS
jgi:sodium/potassium-transporting ATPase subunit alpha